MSSVVITLLLYSIMLILAVVSVGKFKNRKDLLKKIGFKDIKLSDGIKKAVFYLVILFALSIAITTIMNSLGFQSDVEKTSAIITQINVIEVLIILCVASFVEEIFFRGFLQAHTNILVASFIFAFFHITYGSFTEVLGAFVLGMVLGYEFKKTKSLFSPILTHLMYNLITVVLMFTITV